MLKDELCNIIQNYQMTQIEKSVLQGRAPKDGQYRFHARETKTLILPDGKEVTIRGQMRIEFLERIIAAYAKGETLSPGKGLPKSRFFNAALALRQTLGLQAPDWELVNSTNLTGTHDHKQIKAAYILRKKEQIQVPAISEELAPEGSGKDLPLPRLLRKPVDLYTAERQLEERKQEFEIYLTTTLLHRLEEKTLTSLLPNDAEKFLHEILVQFNLSQKAYLKLIDFIKNPPKEETRRKERMGEFLINSIAKTITASFTKMLNNIPLTEQEETITQSCLGLQEAQGYDLPAILNEVCRHFDINISYHWDRRYLLIKNDERRVT